MKALFFTGGNVRNFHNHKQGGVVYVATLCTVHAKAGDTHRKSVQLLQEWRTSNRGVYIEVIPQGERLGE